ncbi:MAG: guanylate kinase [Wolinella sp.]
MKANKGAVLVLSGPSGSGKSSLCKSLFREIPCAYFSVSTTTRAPRADEVEGVHYHFVSKSQFLEGVEQGLFLEWAEVHGNYYGTSKLTVESALQSGKLVVFDIDIQGHRNIKESYPILTTSIFITTPTQQDLRERLIARGSDDEETIDRRVIHAYNEMRHIKEFDYLIINSDFKESEHKLLSIAYSALSRRTLYDVDLFAAHWGDKK